MDSKKLLNILKREEGTKLDFKLRLELWTDSGKKELAKDISAIANSKGGRGYIVVGIEDKSKKIKGVKEDEIFKEEQVQQIITSRCEPPIPIEVDFVNIEGKKVGVITIFDGSQKPYQIRESGAFYIRRGSTTDVMRKQEILRSFEENLDLALETCPVIRSNTNFLNKDLIDKYFRKKGIYITNENKSFLLESAGITYVERESGEEKCTYGGLIVFSEENSVCIPYNMVRIINKVRGDLEEVTIVEGSLLTIIKKTEENINNIIQNNYPKEAIIEAIKNAVLYREYSEINRVIEIVITKKSIIIESPGELIQKNYKGKDECYIGRNMWIYEKLITLDDNNMFLNNGCGFSRMKKAFKGKGRVKFINSKCENSFKVILPGIEG